MIKTIGDAQIIRKIKKIQNSMKKRILRKAISKGLKPIVSIAKRRAPKGKTGLLSKSIKSKVTKKSNGKVFVDPRVIGVKSQATGGGWSKVKVVAERGANRTYAAVKTAIQSQNPDALIKKPAKYAHLVEFGTRRAPAKPFLRPAMTAGRASALLEIEKTVKTELKKE